MQGGNTRFLFETKHNVVLSDTIYIQTPKVVDLNHDVYAVKAWGARRELDVTWNHMVRIGFKGI